MHHYIEGTTEKVAEDVIRSDLTVNSLLVYSATVSGYELAEGTSYVQTATRENSEITFYYKKIADSAYTVNHYYGSNASLTETVTGTAKAGSLVTADVINKAGYTGVTSGGCAFRVCCERRLYGDQRVLRGQRPDVQRLLLSGRHRDACTRHDGERERAREV